MSGDENDLEIARLLEELDTLGRVPDPSPTEPPPPPRQPQKRWDPLLRRRVVPVRPVGPLDLGEGRNALWRELCEPGKDSPPQDPEAE